jgi:hypothetical protein
MWVCAIDCNGPAGVFQHLVSLPHEEGLALSQVSEGDVLRKFASQMLSHSVGFGCVSFAESRPRVSLCLVAFFMIQSS